MLREVKQAPESLAKKIETVLAARSALLAEVNAAAALTPSGGVSRIHGDYHLGQVLISKDDVAIIYFEGEPQRSLDERREKASRSEENTSELKSLMSNSD